jgi:hypothetical protein
MADLILYEAARAALAKARNVDEIKQIITKSAALRAAAKIAKDFDMESDAVEIRLRAERALGWMMQQQPKAKGARLTGKVAGSAKGKGKGKSKAVVSSGGSKKVPPEERPATLSEAGVDKHLADRARKAAAKTDAAFEEGITRIRQRPADRVASIDRMFNGSSMPNLVITHEDLGTAVPNLLVTHKDLGTAVPVHKSAPKPEPTTARVVYAGLATYAAQALELAPPFEAWGEIVADAVLVERVRQTATHWTKFAEHLEAKLAAAEVSAEKAPKAKEILATIA